MPSNTSLGSFICFPVGVLSMTRFFVGVPVPSSMPGISSTQNGAVPWLVFHAPGWAEAMSRVLEILAQAWGPAVVR